MFADFYIPRLQNDMKLAVQKNHLGSQISDISTGPSNKTASLSSQFIEDIFLTHVFEPHEYSWNYIF